MALRTIAIPSRSRRETATGYVIGCAPLHLPIDHLADRAAEQAIQLLDALDRYRLAQYDLEHARHAPSQAREEDLF